MSEAATRCNFLWHSLSRRPLARGGRRGLTNRLTLVTAEDSLRDRVLSATLLGNTLASMPRPCRRPAGPARRASFCIAIDQSGMSEPHIHRRLTADPARAN